MTEGGLAEEVVFAEAVGAAAEVGIAADVGSSGGADPLLVASTGSIASAVLIGATGAALVTNGI